MFIKQISVFLENRPGTLRELTEKLGSNGIDIRELSVADTQHFGIVRMIIRSNVIDEAMALLKSEGYTARINTVICTEIPDEAGGLAKLLGLIEDADLSVEYMYSFRRNAAGNVLLVLRLSEQEEGCKLLQDAGVIVHTQEEADKY